MAYNVLKAEKNEKGIVIHTVIDPENGEKKLVYSAVRGGLAWPTKESNGYFCVLGEEYNDQDKFTKEKPTSKVRFFAEREVPITFLDELFKQLTDDCRLHLADKVYTDLSEEYEDNAEFYREYCYENKIGVGQFSEAPYMKNFMFGISVIRRWLDDGRLDISPDSIAAKQLESITDIDLQGSPEIKYPAINGLRYAIAAFHKFRPSFGPPFKPKRRNRGWV